MAKSKTACAKEMMTILKDDFEAMARAALREMGADLPNSPEDKVISAVETLLNKDTSMIDAGIVMNIPESSWQTLKDNNISRKELEKHGFAEGDEAINISAIMAAARAA